MTDLMLGAPVTNKVSPRHGKEQKFHPSIPCTNTWTFSSSLPATAAKAKTTALPPSLIFSALTESVVHCVPFL
jgi:hypothetical protein